MCAGGAWWAWEIGGGCGAVLTFILFVFCSRSGSGGGGKFTFLAQYCARLRAWGWVRVSALELTNMDQLPVDETKSHSTSTVSAIPMPALATAKWICLSYYHTLNPHQYSHKHLS